MYAQTHPPGRSSRTMDPQPPRITTTLALERTARPHTGCFPARQSSDWLARTKVNVTQVGVLLSYRHIGQFKRCAPPQRYWSEGGDRMRQVFCALHDSDGILCVCRRHGRVATTFEGRIRWRGRVWSSRCGGTASPEATVVSGGSRAEEPAPLAGLCRRVPQLRSRLARHRSPRPGRASALAGLAEMVAVFCPGLKGGGCKEESARTVRLRVGEGRWCLGRLLCLLYEESYES